MYHEQIKRYLDYFQMNNILIIDSTMLFTKPKDVLRRIFQFVGVDTEFTVNDLKPRKVGRNRTEVDSRVYEYLEDFFRPHNEELYEIIGENYSW